jgi:5'-nucleotidase
MLLITNDDGIDALGLVSLVARLDSEHELAVIAPAEEQSAVSHALSLRDPIRAEERSNRAVAVWGTPADCVYMGLHHFFRETPVQLVVSGINKGTNLGTDVHYSGTVAAAKEGALAGVRSLAISLQHSPLAAVNTEANWGTAASVGGIMVKRLLSLEPSAGLLWSLNVPDRPMEDIRGIKLCTLGRRFYSTSATPKGGQMYRLGGEHLRFCDTPGTDGFWFEQGFATLSALSLSWSRGPAQISTSTVEILEAPLS